MAATNVSEMAIMEEIHAGSIPRSNNNETQVIQSVNVDNANKSNSKLQLFLTLLLWMLAIYGVVMSTYNLIAISANSTVACSCSTDDVQSALIAINKDRSTTSYPTLYPTSIPTKFPSLNPSDIPTSNPTYPSRNPSKNPTNIPSINPTNNPTSNPSTIPSLNPSSNPSSNPSLIPSSNPSLIPTINPSNTPSLIPTSNPSLIPTSNPSNTPSINPSSSPTLEPTLSPTVEPTHFDGYFIGDFKFSLQEFDHGFWKLCNGTLLKIDGTYSPLFNVIGYRFGVHNDTIKNEMYFKLPKPGNSVVGIAGNNHLIGDIVGSETIILIENQLPIHNHYVMGWNNGAQVIDRNGASSASLAMDCNFYGGAEYRACVTTPAIEADAFLSSNVGQGASIDIMQPTTFISNLFIYTGVSI